MTSKNKYLGLDPAMAKSIRYHAWRLKRSKYLAHHDTEDIEQDLLYELYSCLSQYNEKKGSFQSFANKVISRRSNNLIYRQLSAKRGAKVPTASLNQENAKGYTLLDSVPDNNWIEQDLEIQIDVNNYISKLPRDWHLLCEQLKVFTVTEIAKISGRSRATIYRDQELIMSSLQAIVTSLPMSLNTLSN